jgi:RNA polymerase sigma-70 factor (ECF subfamily)
VFAFDFHEIARAVGRSEAACRQLAVRARRHMDAGRPRFEANPKAREELTARFLDAVREGEIEGLQKLLVADVQMIADTGGKVPQWGRGVIGAQKVSQIIASMIPPFLRIGGKIESQVVNGQPGAIFRDRDDRVINAWIFEVHEGRIETIRTVLNPDKLAHMGPVADARAVIRELNQERR